MVREIKVVVDCVVRRLSWLIWAGSILSQGHLGVEEKGRKICVKIKKVRKIYTMSDFEDGRSPQAKKCGQPLEVGKG